MTKPCLGLQGLCGVAIHMQNPVWAVMRTFWFALFADLGQAARPSQAAASSAAPLAAASNPAPKTSSDAALPSASKVPAAAPAAAPPASDSDASSQLPIQLSAMRRADVSPFKGAVFVSIREYYEV